MGSGLRAVASRCLSRENPGRTITVLHHALPGDDVHQTPVSMFEDFVSFSGRCNTDEYSAAHTIIVGLLKTLNDLESQTPSQQRHSSRIAFRTFRMTSNRTESNDPCT